MSVLLYEKRGRIVYITMNRPEVLNAISVEMRAKLLDAWQAFRDDDDALVAIVTGAGERAFSTGADMKEGGVLHSSIADLWLAKPPVIGVRGIEIWKPVIAAINGYCVAGGFEIALSCDLRVATANSSFGLSEVTRGIIPAGGGTQRLSRLLPRAIALEMLLCGTRIDAAKAYHFGLINRMVPPGQHIAAAEELAKTIVANAPLSVKAIKEAVLRGTEMSFPDAIRLEMLLGRLVHDTEDSEEGPRAFVEKRPAVFKGR